MFGLQENDGGMNLGNDKFLKSYLKGLLDDTTNTDVEK